MNKEEKKAIEYFKKHKEYFEEQIKIINGLDADVYDEELELYQNRVKQFTLVLNLIQKQEKEIEKLKTKNNDLLRKLRNRVKEVKKLIKYSAYKSEFKNLNERIKKLEKENDLMAEHIFYNQDDKFPIGYSIKDVKEYFKKVVDENVED